jgi:hypothetical protein
LGITSPLHQFGDDLGDGFGLPTVKPATVRAAATFQVGPIAGMRFG